MAFVYIISKLNYTNTLRTSNGDRSLHAKSAMLLWTVHKSGVDA